jgi:hypothetical protein
MPKTKYMKPKILGSMKKQSSADQFFFPKYLIDGVIVDGRVISFSKMMNDPKGYLNDYIKRKRRAA